MEWDYCSVEYGSGVQYGFPSLDGWLIESDKLCNGELPPAICGADTSHMDMVVVSSGICNQQCHIIQYWVHPILFRFGSLSTTILNVTSRWEAQINKHSHKSHTLTLVCRPLMHVPCSKNMEFESM